MNRSKQTIINLLDDAWAEDRREIAATLISEIIRDEGARPLLKAVAAFDRTAADEIAAASEKPAA